MAKRTLTLTKDSNYRNRVRSLHQRSDFSSLSISSSIASNLDKRFKAICLMMRSPKASN